MRKKHKADNLLLGFLIGFLFPIIIFYGIFLGKNESGSFIEYLSGLWHLQALIKLGSLCVFANVAVFWIFLQMKFEKTARGILGATILYAFVVLLSKAL